VSWVFRRPHDYRAQLGRNLFALLAVASATSGSSAVTITLTGTITGIGALAGSCAIGFTTQAAPGSDNCSGVAALSFVPTAAIIAVGQMTGAAAITFANSATVSGSVAYGLSQRFKAAKWRTAEVRYAHQLDKLVIFPFSESTGISGQADIAITPVATLRGTGTLAGAAPSTLSVTGTLRGTGALLGAAAVTFTPQGDLVDGASGEITGVAAFAFESNGALLGSGALAGQSALQFDASLSPGSTQPITGVAPLTLTATATLTGFTVPFGNPDSIYLTVEEARSVFVTIRNA
jgi:hypothetical protein